MIENPHNTAVDKTTYYARNSAEIAAADELIAFHVNGSEGVADTIAKAKEKDLPGKVLTYSIN